MGRGSQDGGQRKIKRPRAGGGWASIRYTLGKARAAGGFWRMFRALRSRNACKTCALGMGGQRGGMVNEAGHFPEVCKKSIQAMAADMGGAIRPHFFNDFTFDKLARFSPRELEAAGRLTQPLHADPIDPGYRPIPWDEALDRIVKRMRAIEPDEAFFYFSGRSSNEAAFLLQLMARVWGTNNVSNCSYYCHQASGVGLASVTGSGTATLILEDLSGCDLLFLIGANPASNHPRFMSSLIKHKRRGGKIIVINPLREVGLVRFRVPSDVRSLLFGSEIADLYVQPHIGGDAALLCAITKAIIELGAVDRSFVEQHAEGWEEVEDQLTTMDWDDLIEKSGVSRAVINQVADLYAGSASTILAWAMGITHHEHGVENVRAIANLAIARGMLGRPGTGLLPLRGHSNVQGIGSVGVAPALRPAVFERMQQALGVTLPESAGMDTLQSLEQANEGKIRLAFNLGGNLYGATPDLAFAGQAMRKINTVIYLSTTLNTGHVHGRGRETFILPVQARDEESQSTTQESMFNYVRLSDGGSARHDGPRSEVDVVVDLAERLFEGGSAVDWVSLHDHDAIRSIIAAVIPGYDAIQSIGHTRQEFQIDGRTFHEPKFNTESGRARCHTIELPELVGSSHDELRLMTLRSEGQFNTVVYEEEDVYRGQERRDVILMNHEDIARLRLSIDQPVTVASSAGELTGILVREGALPPGNAAMYFPEANVLVPRVADAESRTPAYKSIAIRLRTAG